MPVFGTARQGVYSRQLKYKETTAGADPVTPVKYVVPLAGEEIGFGKDQPRSPAVITDGRRTPKGSYLGMITAAGAVPTSLDFNYVGVDLDCHNGHSVYSRVGKVHRWIGQGDPIPFGLQNEHTQTPTLITRHRGVLSDSMNFEQQMSGQARYSLSYVGMGDSVATDVGGSVTDYGASPFTFKAYNYFDGAIYKGGVQLGTVTNFSLALGNKITMEDAAFYGGKKAAYSIGIPVIEGDLGLAFTVEDGLGYFNEAVNNTLVRLECYWADVALSAGPTRWLRFVIPAVLFSATEPRVGGQTSIKPVQHFVAEVPSLGEAAYQIGTVATATTLTVAAATTPVVSITGGADITIPALTTGARTIAQIATQMNADATFAAGALAYEYNGHLAVKTLSPTGTIQFKAGGASFNTLVGFDTTLWSSLAASAIYTELVNDRSTDY